MYLVEAEVDTIVASWWVNKDVAKYLLWLGLLAFPPTVATGTRTTAAHRISDLDDPRSIMFWIFLLIYQLWTTVNESRVVVPTLYHWLS